MSGLFLPLSRRECMHFSTGSFNFYSESESKSSSMSSRSGKERCSIDKLAWR